MRSFWGATPRASRPRWTRGASRARAIRGRATSCTPRWSTSWTAGDASRTRRQAARRRWPRSYGGSRGRRGGRPDGRGAWAGERARAGARLRGRGRARESTGRNPRPAKGNGMEVAIQGRAAARVQQARAAFVLGKPGITALITLSAAAAYIVAGGSVVSATFIHVPVATAFVAA